MFTQIAKKSMALLLSVLLLLAAVPFSVIAATTIDILDGKVSLTDSTGNGSGNATSYKATAKGSLIGKKSNTITVANESSASATVSFSYSVDKSSAFTIDGASATTSGSYSKLLNPGDTIELVITSNSGFSNTTVTLTMTNITYTEAAAESTVTYYYDNTYGSVTVNGNAIENGATSVISLGNADSLVATPVSGATFLGWVKSDNGEIISTASSYSLQPGSDMSVKALFVGANSTPHFNVANAYIFSDLKEAATFASTAATKTVVLMNNATLPAGDYTIPSGVTLLIPFDSANTIYTTKPGNTDSYVKPTAFRTLTMADGANITVNGDLCVAGRHQPGAGANHYGGAPSGPLGFINMNEGSSITVNGNLYAYGYIIGEGNVTAKSGANVYEFFQFEDFRGGDLTTKISNGVFPMTQYYVQNIEVPLTIEAGAIEHCYTSVKVTLLGVQGSSVAFFGQDGAMFNLSTGSVTKRYDGNTDRLIIDVNGKMSISTLKMTLGIYSVDSAKYNMGINGNISVNVLSGSDCTIAQDLSLLPGCAFAIEENANIKVAKGTKVYIYDAEQWGNYCGARNEVISPIMYAPGKKYNRPTALADQVDASIRVDGYIDASEGDVYVTEGGANIYSTGTGVAKISRGSETITYQAIQNTDDFTYVEIPITPIKLKNADGTYLSANCPTGIYTYTNGSWNYVCEHVYTSKVTANPGCDTEGVTTFSCTCGHSYTEAIAPTGHKAGAVATCTNAQTCTVCGKELAPALGHTEVIDAAVEATCTVTGLTEGKHCSVCNTVITEQQVVPVKEHDYDSEIITNAGCGNDGEIAYTCTICGDTYSDLLPATGKHTYTSKVTVEATCTNEGETTYSCTGCEESYAEIIPVIPHTEVIDEAVAPTCTATGLTEGKHCSVCNTVITEQEVVDALGHTEVIDEAVAPTCTETGLTEGKHCSVCVTVITEQEVVDALGHTEVIDEAVAPTCTATGLTEGKHCSVCETVIIEQEVVDALGHTEVIDEGKSATCTEDGITEGKHCSVCETILVEQTVVTATGHNFYIGEDENQYCHNCDYGNVAHVDFVDGAYENGYGWGDIDNDGYISYVDLELLTKIVCNTNFADGDIACKAADVNGDGKIDMKDIVRIKKILGIIPGVGEGAYTSLENIPDYYENN